MAKRGLESGRIAPGEHRGFRLLRQHRGDMFATSQMSEAEALDYHAAMTALKRTTEIGHLLGEDSSPVHAAQVFLELSSQLHATQRRYDDAERHVLEDKIALIASAYAICDGSNQGIGDVLQAARDDHERLQVFAECIRSGSLQRIIQEAFAFLANA